jgi:hypothetical protein
MFAASPPSVEFAIMTGRPFNWEAVISSPVATAVAGQLMGTTPYW